jgi:UDP-GlcNAc:undecaprenyl-phosphate GlcNAc-1-phosphate transferase
MSGWVALAIFPGLLVSVLLAYVVRHLAPRWGLVDRPGHRKVHQTPIPYGGGLAIWAGVVVPLAASQFALEMWNRARLDSAESSSLDWSRFGPWPAALGEFIEPHLPGLVAQSRSLWIFLAAGTVLMLLGLIDDVRRVDWRVRLAVQFAVAAAIVFGLGWKLTLFVNVPVITNAVTLFWIVGLVNSFNMLDNMDALAGGVAAISATLLAIYVLIVPEAAGHPQLFVAGFLFLLVGALTGFLWHNRPPARIFMGDAGSYFIGFCLAVFTILATFSGPNLPRHSILAPLCVLAVPLYDTVSVVCIRLLNGKSPFEGDTNHFSHRLVALGLTKVQAVLTIYLTSTACGLAALVLPQVNALGAAMIALVVVCMLCVIAILEMAARRLARR